MEQRWKEILKERSSTILDSLLGLALGLSAYSLTGFAIEEMRDIDLALVYFSVLFFLMIIFWWAVSTSLAFARYDDRLFTITLILGALLVVTPLCLRLMLSSEPEVKNLGYDLVPLVMGVVSLLGAVTHIIVLRQAIAIPKHELEGMRMMTPGLLLFSAVLLLSLRIPPEATIESHLHQVTAYLPPSLWQLPVRMGAWLAPFPLLMVIAGIVQYGARWLISEPEEEAASLVESKRAVTQKVQAMTNSVFAMAVGLCAYSLTDFAIGSREDLIMALLYFAFTFIVILIFWGELFRVFAAVIYYDETLLWGTILLTYCVTLLPFFFRLVLSSDPTVAGLGMTVFSVFMAAAAIMSSTLFIIALRRRVIEIPKDDLLEMQRAAFGGPIMAIIFLASLRIPTAATLQTYLPQFAGQIPFIPVDFPLRILSWWLVLVGLFVVGGFVELIMERLAR